LAFQAGVDLVAKEYNQKFVLGVLGASLKDENGDGKFEPGEKVTLQLKVRNYGGKSAEQGKLTVVVSDLSSSVTFPAKQAVLKETPSDTEVLYTNILMGSVLGGQEAGAVKLQVKVYLEGKLKATLPLEYAVDSFIKVSSISNPVFVGNPNEWWGSKFTLKNIGRDNIPSGWQAKISSKDKRVEIFQDWIPLPEIRSGQESEQEFYVKINALGDYKNHAFDFVVKDANGKKVYETSLKIPIKTN
jgi:hypothetical protein